MSTNKGISLEYQHCGFSTVCIILNGERSVNVPPRQHTVEKRFPENENPASFNQPKIPLYIRNFYQGK